jgi:class 3 adenylate cyclase
MTGQPCEIGILFADIAGSTRLYEDFGDEASLAAVTACFRLMTDAVQGHGGRIVRTLGDEVLATFRAPEPMIAAAVALQIATDAQAPLRGPHGITRLAIRAGCHFGPAIEDGGDVYGDTVNVAARMRTLARAGQIITTDAVRELLSPLQGSALRDLGEIVLKGKAKPVRALEVLWQQTPEMTVLNLPSLTPSPRRPAIKLRQDEQAWTFDAEHGPIAIGRAADCDVVLADQQASRRHATIERRQDKWILIDHSTNGTFVTFLGEPEIRVSREELILQRPGTASFGQPSCPAQPGIRFSFV